MSWKKYGGTYKTDVLNSASINHLVAGTFIVRDSYVGVLDICGSMHVSEDIYYGRDLFGGRDASLNGNLLVGGETGILGNVKLGGNVNISRDTTIGSWLSVTGNISLGGNLAVGDNATVGNNLSVSNRLYFGNSINTFITSSPGQSLGVNVSTPAAAAWDISGSRIEQLHVYTTAATAKSVVVQNTRGHGVAMTGTDASSSVLFYVDTSMNPAGAGGAGNTIAKSAPDGAISMFAEGNMRIDASSNVLVSSRMVVSNRSPTALGTWPATAGIISPGSKHVNDEALVVYDLNRYSTLLPDYYNYSNNAALSGTAATLVAVDTSSTTFMRWSTPDLTGWAIGGGAYPMDSTRTFGTGGMTDATGKYNPTWVAVAGNSKTHYKTTFAVNSYAPPLLDNCIMHVNGPVVITNSELTVSATVPFEINSIQFGRGPSGGNARRIGIAVGSPSLPNTNVLWFSKDGGGQWQASSTVVTTTPPSPSPFFRAASIYSSQIISPPAQNAVAVGDNGIIYLSNDAGTTWFQLLGDSFTSAINQPFSETVVSSKGNDANTMRVFLMYTISTDAIGGNPATKKSYMRYFDSTITNFVASTQFFVSDPLQFIFGNTTQRDQFIITGADVDNNSTTGNTPTMWVCGTGAILRYLVSSGGGAPILMLSSKLGENYNAIHVAYFDATFVAAVGEGIISVTHNSGTTWVDTRFANGITFLSVYIYDANQLIACGYNGSMAYSIDGGATWKFVPPDLIGAGGSGWQWTSANSTLTDISMPDINTIVLRRVSAGEYPFPGKSQIYTGWLPSLFNRSNNHVLDVCGNMMLSGDLWLNDGGIMQSNTPANQTVSLFPETRQSISFGPNTTEITTGKLVVGKSTSSVSGLVNEPTSRSGALVVAGGATVKGNLMSEGYMFVSAGIQGAEGSLSADPNAVTRQIKIGDGSFGNTFIKIGNPDDVNSENVRNYISIGGQNDYITFNGTLALPQINSTNEKTYNLNFGNTGPTSAFYCGLNFYNDGFFNAGWFLTDLSMHGFLLKSPLDSTVVRFLNKSLKVITDVDASSNSVVIMRKPAANSIDISFEMVSVDIDYRNILLRNIAVASAQTINSDVTITGILNANRNVLMDMDCTVGKDIVCNQNLDVNGATHLLGAVTLDNNLTWTGNKFALTGTLVQGGPATPLQFNQIDAIPKTIPDAIGNVLNLGCGSNTDVVIVGGSSARVVRIGTPSITDLSGGNVFIGGTNYITSLSGNVILPKTVYTMGTWTAGQPPSTAGLLQFSTKTIEVNASATGTGTSAESGLLVRDNNGTAGAGRIVVSNDMKGWLFKAPKNTEAGANNVVNFSVNTLSLQPGGPGTGDPDYNAFVVLQKSPAWNGGVLFDSSYTVTTSNTITGVANFSSAQPATSTTTGAVRISTGGLGVAGNIYVGGNVFVPTRQVIVNKVAASDPASQMEVGGNTILQRLTVGSGLLTNPAYALTVSGQMMQSAGFVWQF